MADGIMGHLGKDLRVCLLNLGGGLIKRQATLCQKVMILTKMAVWSLFSVYSSGPEEKPLWPHSWADISKAINQRGYAFVCPVPSSDGLPLWRGWMRREAERCTKVKAWHLVIQKWGTGVPSGCSASQKPGHIVVVAVDTKLEQNVSAVQQFFYFFSETQMWWWLCALFKNK